MKYKRLLIIAVTIVFLMLVALVVFDMARKTTQPWERKKSKTENKIF